MTASPRAHGTKAAPKNRAEPISPGRRAAFDILMAVERGDSHSDDLLRGERVTRLSHADRNLTTALVLGALRWQIRLDQQLRALLNKPDARLDASVLVALRLGAFQILHMDRIPAHAAIDDSVELVKRQGQRFASGMVNAVLRKVAGIAEQQFPEGSATEFALAEAHPAWIVERWRRFYGDETAKAICRSNQSQPSLVIRLSDAGVESELTRSGIKLDAGSILSAARVVTAGDIFASDAFRQGRVRVQDEGSQLVAEIAAASSVQPDGRILDACAAPGGKTIVLAERNPCAHILACESSSSRMEQLRLRVAGHGDRIECRLADATALDAIATFDLALADVPCSGTGTLGRNPEIRHRLRIEDLQRQAVRQRAILRSVLASLRPGGHAVYSTCSLEPEENDEVIAAVLSDLPGMRLISIEPAIDALMQRSILTESRAELVKAALTPAGTLRLLPGLFHTDGFFVALIERTL